MPASEPVLFDHYRYLVKRPEKGREQPYLRGRNMTVGQLIYTIRANNLTIKEAAEDFNLPVEQVLEAQAYYQTHSDLIASEMAQETLSLLERGVNLEPVPLAERGVVPPHHNTSAH
ncbi:MAG: hypothetical protein V9H69_22050 [Anaerolineae bacterium]